MFLLKENGARLLQENGGAILLAAVAAAGGGGGAFRGALVYWPTTQAFTGLAWGVMSWDTESYGTDGIWDSGQTTRLTVPSGVTKVKLIANFNYDKTNDVLLTIRKNQTTAADATSYPGAARASWDPDYNMAGGLASPVLSVVAGDWFDLAVNARTSGNALTQSTWFAMEIIE